jgi:putative hydrolase of the HAD superfamily
MPGHVASWIFDLDNTLYSASSGVFDQIDARMKAFIARELGLPPEDAFWLQKRYFHAHGTTLRGLMLNHGTDPDAFLDFVHDIDHSILDPDHRLAKALAALPGRKVVFTNGTAGHARRVIDRLEIGHLIEAIFDIRAADYVPKPNAEPYRKMIAAHGIAPAAAAMFEDSSANLKPAAEIGMTTVWVRHAQAVHPAPDDTGHCHYVTDDLTAWLETTARRIAAA